MALTINTNLSSMIVQRNLAKSTNQLNNAIERMTTGYKINHAADNAAGYSIAKNWEAQLGSLDVAADNAATGADMLATLEDNYSLIASHVQRVRDLTEQASNGTYGKDSLVAIKSEITARLEEINRIAANCEFNGVDLMTGTTGGIESDLNIQVGIDGGVNSRITLESSLFDSGNMTGLFKDMGDKTATDGKKLKEILTAAGGSATSHTNLTTEENIRAFACACSGLTYADSTYSIDSTPNCGASQMLTFLDEALNKISEKVTKIGAGRNRIDSAIESIAVQSENITSSLSTLRDADVAKESSNYIKAQILQQASATLLATANQSPSIALNLL